MQQGYWLSGFNFNVSGVRRTLNYETLAICRTFALAPCSRLRSRRGLPVVHDPGRTRPNCLMALFQSLGRAEPLLGRSVLVFWK